MLRTKENGRFLLFFSVFWHKQEWAINFCLCVRLHASYGYCYCLPQKHNANMQFLGICLTCFLSLLPSLSFADRLNTSNAIDSAVKPEGPSDKASESESPESSCNPKQEAAETPKSPSSESAEAVNAKQAQKKGIKTKAGPKRK